MTPATQSDFLIQLDEEIVDFDSLKSLTRREWEVILRLSKGLTTSQIADEIYVEPKSVENYRSRIAKKLSLNGRNRLVWYCWKNQGTIEKCYGIFTNSRENLGSGK